MKKKKKKKSKKKKKKREKDFTPIFLFLSLIHSSLPTTFTSEAAEGRTSKGSEEGAGVWNLRREARWEADRRCVCYAVQVSVQETPNNFFPLPAFSAA